MWVLAEDPLNPQEPGGSVALDVVSWHLRNRIVDYAKLAIKLVADELVRAF
jgi:hypothetical protein